MIYLFTQLFIYLYFYYIYLFLHLFTAFSGIWQSEVRAFCENARVCWRHFESTNILCSVRGETVVLKRKGGADPDVTDEEFICNNARHDLGDGIPGSTVQVPLALNRLGIIRATELSTSGKHPFTADRVEASLQSYLEEKRREQAQLQTDAAKQQKKSAKQTSSLERQLKVSKRKLTEQLPPGQDALGLVHDGLVYRKQLDDDAARRAALVDQFIQKCTKKGVFWRSFRLALR